MRLPLICLILAYDMKKPCNLCCREDLVDDRGLEPRTH